MRKSEVGGKMFGAIVVQLEKVELGKKVLIYSGRNIQSKKKGKPGHHLLNVTSNCVGICGKSLRLSITFTIYCLSGCEFRGGGRHKGPRN